MILTNNKKKLRTQTDNNNATDYYDRGALVFDLVRAKEDQNITSLERKKH